MSPVVPRIPLSPTENHQKNLIRVVVCCQRCPPLSPCMGIALGAKKRAQPAPSKFCYFVLPIHNAPPSTKLARWLPCTLHVPHRMTKYNVQKHEAPRQTKKLNAELAQPLAHSSSRIRLVVNSFD